MLRVRLVLFLSGYNPQLWSCIHIYIYLHIEILVVLSLFFVPFVRLALLSLSVLRNFSILLKYPLTWSCPCLDCSPRSLLRSSNISNHALEIAIHFLVVELWHLKRWDLLEWCSGLWYSFRRCFRPRSSEKAFKQRKGPDDGLDKDAMQLGS